jgi:hypothetical protein
MRRGEIGNRGKAKQLRDFSGLVFGKITPTDVDALIEYHGICYVIIEAKTGTAKMPFGQRLALERICDDLQKSKPTILILATHDTPEDEDVDYSSMIVLEYRYEGVWKTTKTAKTTRKLIEEFFNQMEAK